MRRSTKFDGNTPPWGNRQEKTKAVQTGRKNTGTMQKKMGYRRMG